ncbi:MAG: DUF4878 domain-containing protein [Clostridia bacterium]|nr:DUF4878 domain-containing protein [Clostridia bacterium]
MALGFMKKISPEYVVEHAIKDVKSTGIDGLKPYLTENAEKNVATIKNVSGGVSLLTGSNKVSVLLDKLADCNWTVVEILKGSESANAIVGFAIKTKSEEIEGTIRLTLIKEDKEWKIDGVEMPKFEKFTISSAD